jgi:uncharacterized membrane protein
MALRSALAKAWFVTIPVLAFLAWILLKALDVYSFVETAGSGAVDAQGTAIGTSFVAGVVGLLVMLVVVLLFVVLFSELGEDTPAPSPWPPNE